MKNLIRLILIVPALVVCGSALCRPRRHVDQVMIDSPGSIQIGDPEDANRAAVISYRTHGVEECRIDFDLHVTGDKRVRCVEHLERVARLARAEMMVNEKSR